MSRRSIMVMAVSLLGAAALAAGREAPSEGRLLVDQSYFCLRTLAEMRSVRTALEAYVMDHATLPQVDAVEDVRALIEPDYIRAATLTDAWGTALRLEISADGRTFSLASAGSDRTFQRDSWGLPGLRSHSNEDAVLFSVPGHRKDREWVIQE